MTRCDSPDKIEEDVKTKIPTKYPHSLITGCCAEVRATAMDVRQQACGNGRTATGVRQRAYGDGHTAAGVRPVMF